MIICQWPTYQHLTYLLQLYCVFYFHLNRCHLYLMYLNVLNLQLPVRFGMKLRFSIRAVVKSASQW